MPATGGPTICAPVRPRRYPHAHLHVSWRRWASAHFRQMEAVCVCGACARAHRVSAEWASHPASPAEVESKHCWKVQQPHPPPLPSWSLVLFQPNLAARPRGVPPPTSRTPHCLFPPIPWEVLTSQPLPCRPLCPEEGQGRVPPSEHPAQWGLPPVIRSGDAARRVVLFRPRLLVSYFVLTSGNQGRRTQLYFPSSWNPLINVNWL